MLVIWSCWQNDVVRVKMGRHTWSLESLNLNPSPCIDRLHIHLRWSEDLCTTAPSSVWKSVQKVCRCASCPKSAINSTIPATPKQQRKQGNPRLKRFCSSQFFCPGVCKPTENMDLSTINNSLERCSSPATQWPSKCTLGSKGTGNAHSRNHACKAHMDDLWYYRKHLKAGILPWWSLVITCIEYECRHVPSSTFSCRLRRQPSRTAPIGTSTMLRIQKPPASQAPRTTATAAP